MYPQNTPFDIATMGLWCLTLELTGRGKWMQAAMDSSMMKLIQSALRLN